MVVDESSLILPFDNDDRLSSTLDNHNTESTSTFR